jgi:hypothetical protein
MEMIPSIYTLKGNNSRHRALTCRRSQLSGDPMRNLRNAEYYRFRAAEVRLRANTFDDVESRRMMFAIAENYDFLAEGADGFKRRDELRRRRLDSSAST